jgi:superfamily II DNA or RNA helicase
MAEQVTNPQATPESPFTGASYANAIHTYVSNPENTTLRGRQPEVMDDVEAFFRDGHTRGYINSPTGSGKTVMQVAIAQALINGHLENPPKVLIVEPTKDLVTQTISARGEKGFGQFAPELYVGSFFGDSKDKERQALKTFDTVVTTYHSFHALGRRTIDMNDPETAAALSKAKDSVDDAVHFAGRQALATERKLDHFDIVILDEAHHALGPTTEALINSLSPETIVIGFTASPDIDDDRLLTSVLPNKIHEFSLVEAIDIGMLAPIVPVGIKSGIRIDSKGLFDASGEFVEERISYLAQSPARNKMIIDAAYIFSERGIGTIISCLAGNEVEHARLIAEMARQAGMTASAVHGKMSTSERQRIYTMFEAGAIDILTYVGVLGEGWDSNRAKALINARPTRSQIVSLQRPGRILRAGETAYSIDILDEIEGENQPITVADVLNVGSIAFGTPVGDIEDQVATSDILDEIKTKFDVAQRLESRFKDNKELLRSLPKTHRGRLKIEKDDYAVPGQISARFRGVTQEVIEWLAERSSAPLPTIQTAHGQTIRTVYKTVETVKLLDSLPVVNTERYFVDADLTKWISTKGLAKLFGQRYPEVSATTIATIIRTNQIQPDWRPVVAASTEARFDTFNPKQIERLFATDAETIEVINVALAEYYA